jgi:hypothetical protein
MAHILLFYCCKPTYTICELPGLNKSGLAQPSAIVASSVGINAAPEFKPQSSIFFAVVTTAPYPPATPCPPAMPEQRDIWLQCAVIG